MAMDGNSTNAIDDATITPETEIDPLCRWEGNIIRHDETAYDMTERSDQDALNQNDVKTAECDNSKRQNKTGI